MTVTVKEPGSEIPLQLQVKPERYNTEPGFRISYANGASFFISNKLGTWRLLDDHHVEPELLIEIGLAIEGIYKEKL